MSRRLPDYDKRDSHEIEMNEDVDQSVDPDSPFLTGREVMVPARDLFLKKHAEITAQIAARKKAEQVDRDEPVPVTKPIMT